MCGNVTEWCLNPRPNGFAALGGSWRDGPHTFAQFGRYPGFYRSDTLGFRCAMTVTPSSNDQGAMPLLNAKSRVNLTPVSQEEYRLIRTHYEYDKKPLEAEVIETVETADWRRLKIRYVGAKAQRTEGFIPLKQRALAYLWLPKNSQPPYQVIFYKPGAASYQGLLAPQETEVVCGPFLKAGRAVYEVVIEGMRERDLPADWKQPDPHTVAYRDMMVYDTLDQRIGLDYLAERSENDIDLEKIACMGLSSGGYDLITMTVEDRFKAIFLLSAGLGIEEGEHTIPAADPVNFAPYLRAPKLMIHGRYDEGLPLKTAALPLFKLLSQPKELIVLDTGHFPPISQWYPVAQAFFDRELGPVNR
jgi:hypothetical protein